MRTVVISSDRRKLGKTLLGQKLTAGLVRSGLTAACLKLSRDGHGPALPSSSPGPSGSDTGRYSASGAKQVLFFRYSSPDGLREFMEAQDLDADVRIIESNSVLDFITPDLHIHIVSPEEGKPSARGLSERAGLVLEGPLSPERAEKVAGLVPVLLGMGDGSSISIGGKHWLNIQGKPLFGEGRMDLLKAVRDTGSILQAAGTTGIQYKRAWVLLRDAEDRLGAKLLFSGRGGSGGGGTRLTPLAVRLLEIWERSEKDFNEMLKRLEVR